MWYLDLQPFHDVRRLSLGVKPVLRAAEWRPENNIQILSDVVESVTKLETPLPLLLIAQSILSDKISTFKYVTSSSKPWKIFPYTS